MSFTPDDSVPLLTAEEAERAGTVLLRCDDGRFILAATFVDPETGSVMVEAVPGAKPFEIHITDGD